MILYRLTISINVFIIITFQTMVLSQPTFTRLLLGQAKDLRSVAPGAELSRQRAKHCRQDRLRGSLPNSHSGQQCRDWGV
ncbi:hypothetical protein FGO68_gene911 [Halteria grandinella]|uniref:Uncharacterized protein n=1 Tax=Halteria grandinella TaxID=5974 RepID=A0A8J8TA42_HALGN|nr:hypothetical protein FGO68_gene911 [Halteria grandinella]